MTRSFEIKRIAAHLGIAARGPAVLNLPTHDRRRAIEHMVLAYWMRRRSSGPKPLPPRLAVVGAAIVVRSRGRDFPTGHRLGSASVEKD